MFRTSFSGFFLVFFLFLISCNKTGSKEIYLVVEMEAQQVDFLTDEKTLLVDSRSVQAFNSSHYPTSVNITSNMIKNSPTEVMKVLNSRKYNRIVVYCYGNSCDTSSLVARHLVYTGKDVCVYKAGWENIKYLCPKSQESSHGNNF